MAEPYYPIEQPVRIADGEETRVSLRASAGARVRLTLRLAGDAKAAPGLRVLARPADGSGDVDLADFIIKRPTGTLCTREVQFGAASVCRPILEPGRYELVVEAERFAPLHVPFFAERGRLVDVEAELEPK